MALIPFQQALDKVIEAAAMYALANESIGMGFAAGRIAAADIRAPFAVPGFRHSAMDGFAIQDDRVAATNARFRSVGQILAGDPPFRSLEAGEAVLIATGAMLPDGATRVFPREASRMAGEDAVLLDWGEGSPPHIRGAEDDYAAGALAIAAGGRLGFAALGALASFGMSQVCVAKKPRVSVLVTGSELVPAGAPRAPGQIHDSNGATLRGLLLCEDIETTPALALTDDAALIRGELLCACAESDLVISSGGASAGVADFMPRLLDELGEVIFWKVAMRPGMPILFGRIGSCLVVGLPGNPVAVVAGFLSLVRPMLRRMQGAPPPVAEYARLAETASKHHDRLEFRRARLHIDEQGIQRAHLHAALSSGVLRSVVESNALVILEAERHQWNAGDVVTVMRYDRAV